MLLLCLVFFVSGMLFIVVSHLVWNLFTCQFIEKRREMKQEGRTEQELSESFCFLFPDKSKVLTEDADFKLLFGLVRFYSFFLL